MYLSIDESWLEDRKEQALEKHERNVGEESHEETPSMDFPNIDVHVHEIRLEGDQVYVSYTDNKGFYLSMEVPIDRIRDQITNYVIKKLKKSKEKRQKILEQL